MWGAQKYYYNFNDKILLLKQTWLILENFNEEKCNEANMFILFYYYYMRLLLKLQLILHETITDIYKLDYYWNQLTLILMELYLDFNPQ